MDNRILHKFNSTPLPAGIGFARFVASTSRTAWPCHPIRIRLRGMFVFAALVCIMGAASIQSLAESEAVLLTQLVVFRHYLIAAGLGVLVVVHLDRMGVVAQTPWLSPLGLAWTCFALCHLASSFFHLDSHDALFGFWFLLGAPCLFFTLLPRTHPKLMEIGLLAFVASHLPYLVASLVLTPVVAPYRGVFANPNTLGIVAASTAVSMLCLLRPKTKRKISSPCVAVLLLSTLGLLTLVLLSGSRTSLAALIAAMLVFGTVGSGQRYGKLLVLLMVAITVLLPLLLFHIDRSSPWSYALRKHIARGGGLSGRDEVWSATLSDARLLGHGLGYFSGASSGVNAHNSIIQEVGVHGVAAAFGLLAIALSSLAGAYRYAVRRIRYDPYAMGPLLILVVFWGMAMGEGMFGGFNKGLTILMLVSCGVVIDDQMLLVRSRRSGWR